VKNTEGAKASEGHRLAALLVKERAMLLEQRRDEMMKRATEAATHVKKKYGVAAVYLFGSLAGGRVRRCSEIDMLAFRAAPDIQRIPLAAEVERMLLPFEGHVVFADEVSDHVRRSALKRGVKISCR